MGIRLLLLRQTEPHKFAIAQTFMDHDADRRRDPEYWDHSVSTVITPIVESFGKNNIGVTFEEVCKAVFCFQCSSRVQ